MQNVNFDHQREQLVETELRMLGIRDPAVLQAMRAVPREEFVAEPIKQVRAAHPDSYEGLMHLAEMDAFFLPLSKSKNRQLISALTSRRIGTGDWRDLSPRNRATQPLLRCLAPRPVRRMALV